MKPKKHSLYSAALIALLSLTISACNKAPEKAPDKASDKVPEKTANKHDKLAAPSATLLIAAEDLYTVRSDSLSSGPAITGSIQPERRADLRTEVSAVVLQVLKENGDAVNRGDLLVRLDDTAIRDSLASADAATRAAKQALDQAERQFQRMTTLRGSGMASAQQLDDAENRRNGAQSDLEGAKSRTAQARQQLQRTEVRAPFNGIVADRKASVGDTVQIGKELVKVIDPTSMRFEGLVSADNIGSVKSGEQVVFRVNGYGEQKFIGKIRRVNPSANATTRQVEVLVDFIDKKQPKLGGLYAEGQIETNSVAALTIPATALVRDGDKTAAWRVNTKDNTLEKATIVVGERDNRSGDFPLKSGLSEGEKVIRHPSSTLANGQKIDLNNGGSVSASVNVAFNAANATINASASESAAASTNGK